MDPKRAIRRFCASCPGQSFDIEDYSFCRGTTLILVSLWPCHRHQWYVVYVLKKKTKGKFLGLRRAPSASLPSPVLPAVPDAEVAFQVTIPKLGAPSAAAAVVRDVTFEVTVPGPGAPPAVSSLAARHAGTCRA